MRKGQAAESARTAAAEADREAVASVRQAAEKFSGLTGLRLVVVRDRKLFDRCKAIVGESDGHQRSYTAVDEMRCWILPHTRNHGRIVLTERGQLVTVGMHARIRTRDHTDVVIAEADLRPTDMRRTFTPSGDMSGRADVYVTHLNHVLAQAFVEYERATQHGSAALTRALSGRHDA